MANLWDDLKFHAGIAGDNFLEKSTIGKLLKGTYDSTHRLTHPTGDYNPNQAEDAFNVAAAAMTGGMPFAPSEGLLAGIRNPKQLDLFGDKAPKYKKEKPFKERKFTGKVPVQEDLFRGDVVPQSYIDAYKIFKLKAGSPGDIFPLFIGKTKPIPQGEWMAGENLPTKNYSDRPGWHAGDLPYASHLMKLDGTMPGDRVWGRVSLPDDVPWQKHLNDLGLKGLKDNIPEGGNYDFVRPDIQGSKWKIGGALKVNELLSDEEVAAILKPHGLQMPARDAELIGLYEGLMKMLGKK